MVVPPNGWLIMENPRKMDDDWGYPYFRNPAYPRENSHNLRDPQGPSINAANRRPSSCSHPSLVCEGRKVAWSWSSWSRSTMGMIKHRDHEDI